MANGDEYYLNGGYDVCCRIHDLTISNIIKDDAIILFGSLKCKPKPIIKIKAKYKNIIIIILYIIL